MSFKGGYKIINLNGVSVSSAPVTISGLYELILDNHEKMIVISGLKSGGVLYDDSPAFVSMDTDGNLILQMGIHKLTVTDEDAVTFEDVEQAIKNDIESIESDVTSLESDVNALMNNDLITPVNLTSNLHQLENDNYSSGDLALFKIGSLYKMVFYIEVTSDRDEYPLGKNYENVVEIDGLPPRGGTTYTIPAQTEGKPIQIGVAGISGKTYLQARGGTSGCKYGATIYILRQ